MIIGVEKARVITKNVIFYHRISFVMSFFGTAGEYIKLARLHSAVLSGLTLLFGALAMSVNIDPITIAGLFLVGIFVHIFGFALNEYFDMEVDRRLDILADKPLISGTITPRSALIFCGIAAVASYLLLIFLISSEEPWLPRLFLILSLLVFYAYDRWGKRWVVADALLAGFVGFLCLAGASAVAWPMNALAILVAILAFGQLFLQNALANMKDVVQDREAGAKTTALRLGVKVKSDGVAFIIPNLFKSYILTVKFIHIAFVFGYLVFYTNYEPGQVVIITIAIILMMVMLYRILWMKTFRREKLLRLIGGHELVTYAIIPLLFIGILNPLTIILLIILPVVWLAAFMQIIYGRLLPNI